MKFEWDSRKAALNLLKHGMSPAHRLVVVVHTDRDDRVRIISARPATRAETKKHEKA